MDATVWLKAMFRRELDLRPPSLAQIIEVEEYHINC